MDIQARIDAIDAKIAEIRNNMDAHDWINSGLGHTVYVPVIESTEGVYSDPEFGEIPLRYYHQTCSKNYRSLPANVIHSIDGFAAREVIRRCNFQISHIHDCFVFSPDHLQDVAGIYREVMAEIAKGNLFRDILRQITGDHSLEITKFSHDLDKDILNSEYMLS